jgi:epoxyqueuosine reductase
MEVMTEPGHTSNIELFEANPSLFLMRSINRLPAFDNDPIFDDPLVGYADGDDAIFQNYKKIIGDFHMTPREILAMHLESKESRDKRQPPRVSVISWILPITYKTRLSLYQESLITSLRWNHTRWQGETFMKELANYVVHMLEELGYQAVAPVLTNFFEFKDLPDGLASTWSERHIAHAAGLGTFGLSDGFITPSGMAMRCGSVVCNAAFPPSPRVYPNHLTHCLFYRDGSCRLCSERCPADAISEQGHDKKRCLEFLFNEQRAILKKQGKEEGYIGIYLGCGLCQTKVPCEDKIPPP